MSRFVVPKKTGPFAAAPGEAPDTFGARLAKYIPGEIVTLFTMAVGSVAAAKASDTVNLWVAVCLIAIFLAATVFYMWRNAPPGNVRRAHLIVAPVAFLAWAYPLSAPLLGDWFLGLVAALAQIIVALLAWLIVP